MRVALVYVLAVVTAVMGFALYWQERRLSEIQDAFLKSSNELSVKAAEVDQLRQRKSSTEERAYFAEARLREIASEKEGSASQIEQAHKLRNEAEAALTRAQAQVRAETQAKTAAEGRIMELEGKLERALSELEGLKAGKSKTSAAAQEPAPRRGDVQSDAEPQTTTPAVRNVTTAAPRKVMIEPDPRATANPPPTFSPAREPPQTTEAITPPTGAGGTETTPPTAAPAETAPAAAKTTTAAKPAVRRKARSASATKRKPKAAPQSEFFFPF